MPPQSFEEFRDLVGHCRPALTGQLAAAASFLLANPDDSAWDTVKNLAVRAGVSPSSFVRLAQGVGLPSFSHLRRLFGRPRLPDGSSTAAHDGLSDVVQAAETALLRIDIAASRAAIAAAVRVLAPADTIFLAGLKRLPASMSALRRALDASGIRHLVIDQVPGMAAEMIDFASTADAAVVAGCMPLDSETQGLVGRLTSRKVPFITFSTGPDRSWASHSRAHFDVSDGQVCPYDLSIAGLCLTTSLAHDLASIRASLKYDSA